MPTMRIKRWAAAFFLVSATKAYAVDGGSTPIPPSDPGSPVMGWQVGGQCVVGDMAAMQMQCSRLSGVTQEGITLCRDPVSNGQYLGQLWMLYTVDTTTGAGVNNLYENKTILLQPCQPEPDPDYTALYEIWGAGVALCAGIWAFKNGAMKMVANQ